MSLKKIKKLRTLLNKYVVEYGTQDERTRKVSKEIDVLINEYYASIKIRDYRNNTMPEHYKRSYEELERYTRKLNRFPTVEEWNKYAKANYLLSVESIKYISMLDWNYIEAQIKKGLNLKKN